jgi:hypothetical protein
MMFRSLLYWASLHELSECNASTIGKFLKTLGSAITEAQAIREFAKFVKAFGFGEALTPADQHAVSS